MHCVIYCDDATWIALNRKHCKQCSTAHISHTPCQPSSDATLHQDKQTNVFLFRCFFCGISTWMRSMLCCSFSVCIFDVLFASDWRMQLFRVCTQHTENVSIFYIYYIYFIYSNKYRHFLPILEIVIANANMIDFDIRIHALCVWVCTKIAKLQIEMSHLTNDWVVGSD